MSASASATRRTAIVTGASSGTGAAIARALGGLGWSVALGARRMDRLAAVAAEVRENGGTAFAHYLDVADADSVSEFFDAAEKEFGAVEVAVSNAGVCIPGLAHEVAPEDLRAEVATNLLGPMYMAQRAIPAMIESRSGDLVFISSDTARAPRPYQAGYGAAKSGVESFASTLAMELEGSGVRVVTIRMGPTESEFGRDWPADLLKSMLASWKHFGLQRNLAFIDPDVVARAVVDAVTTPKGSRFALIELQPEGPVES